MRYGIIPDVHQNIEKAQHIREVLMELGVRNFIYLGDWFDSFTHDGLHLQTADYLVNLLENTDDIFIMGNHDAYYAFPEARFLRAAGFKISKFQELRTKLFEKHWNRFVFAHKIGSWLFSHAGLHPNYCHPVFGFESNYIKQLNQFGVEFAKTGMRNTPALYIGHGRGGNEAVGGLMWLDFGIEFEPIDGLNQVVGHTCRFNRVRNLYTDMSINYCIDTALNHFSIYDSDSDTVKIYNYRGVIEMDILSFRYKTPFDRLTWVKLCDKKNI